MSHRNTPNPRKASFWRDALHRWRQSRLSILAFCRQEGLSSPSFHYWRRILTQADPTLVTPPSARNLSSDIPVTFVPIEVRPDAPNSSASLELVFDDGRQLRIPAGFDLDTLRGVLKLLEDRPCST